MVRTSGYTLLRRWCENIVLLRTACVHAVEALTILEPLDSVDAEHRRSKSCMQLAEFRLTQSGRTALDDTGDDTTDGVALSLDLGNQSLHLGSLLWIRTAHSVALCL